MGEGKGGALRANSDRKPKLQFHGIEVTSDAKLLTYRELDEAVGMAIMIE